MEDLSEIVKYLFKENVSNVPLLVLLLEVHMVPINVSSGIAFFLGYDQVRIDIVLSIQVLQNTLLLLDGLQLINVQLKKSGG